jgi:hypothetical protein
MANNVTRKARGGEGSVKLNLPETVAPLAFPLILFSAAVIKDFADILDITVLGIVFTTLGSFIIWFWTFMWLLGKRGIVEKIIKKMKKTIIFLFIADLIPGVKIISGASFLILMIYLNSKKAAAESQATNAAIIRLAKKTINR